MHAMDGRDFLGDRIVVQPHRPGLRGVRGPPSHQVVAPPPRDRGPAPTGRDQRTGFRVLVFNLDERVSWQDLKDFGRNAGDVNFANVFNYRGRKVGVIEYFSEETMQRALHELEDRRLYRTRVHMEADRGQLNQPERQGGQLSKHSRGSRSRSPHHRGGVEDHGDHQTMRYNRKDMGDNLNRRRHNARQTGDGRRGSDDTKPGVDDAGNDSDDAGRKGHDSRRQRDDVARRRDDQKRGSHDSGQYEDRRDNEVDTRGCGSGHVTTEHERSAPGNKCSASPERRQEENKEEPDDRRELSRGRHDTNSQKVQEE
eukprot:GHVQ01025861.1.p2 GENE.GHVQ01025861.1~~GHVQ01025861.1.p2  ORF type:complete len:312 (+),score=38.74 GHVQ01025861.1:975-1910(+)